MHIYKKNKCTVEIEYRIMQIDMVEEKTKYIGNVPQRKQSAVL